MLLKELSGYISAPDSNKGAGYGNTSGGMGGNLKASNDWPYVRLTDMEEESESVDVEDDNKAISKKTHDEVPLDHGRRGQKHHAFVKSATRGLTGIMASVEPHEVLEALAGAIGQSSPSYNVTGNRGPVSIRPGRRTGMKRGWFGPPVPKEEDPEISRFSLKDIASIDREAEPVKKANIIKKRSQEKKSATNEQIDVLRTYIEFVADE